MSLGVGIHALAVAFLLLMLSPHASSRSYYIELPDTGWNTGERQSTSLTMDISGFSMGQGNYSRYGEVGINDVRVKDRTFSQNGTLYYIDGIHVNSSDINDTTFEFQKNPDSQDYLLTVNEAWPVHIDASRSLDFSGKSINDRVYFGNNYENAGSSFLHATNLRKDTSVVLDLRNVHFYAVQNDTTKKMVVDEFMPNLTMLYHDRSSFTGLATFKTTHSVNRKPAIVDEESYLGTFTVTRTINSTSANVTRPWFYYSGSGYDWLGGCCMSPSELVAYSLPASPEVIKNV